MYPDPTIRKVVQVAEQAQQPLHGKYVRLMYTSIISNTTSLK